ncbi:twin-arginine translocase subunit TatC [Agromyces atrinae]|uniref:twin-arginine translocase subunit TatC n=1 Tax=Agromyces atrinae TaxID=592376 RepID=UPI0027E1FDA2|nr:twin-arginine translocase subunit TatC [Agromyces atrinae]
MSVAGGAQPIAAGTMTLSAHLREARTRIFRTVVAVLVGVAIGYVVSGAILDVLRAPILELAESRDASLNYDSVSGAFELKLTIAIFAGLVISSPYWLYQVFAFFVPGLTRRERRYTFAFFFSAVPLFAAGCTTGFLLFPHIVELLASFASTEDSTLLQARYYVEFVMKLVLAVGVAFVLPVFVVLLNAMGVLSGASIVRSWRIVLTGIVVFCALATPAADIASMFLLALPMVVLFAGAAGIALLHDRSVTRRALATAPRPPSLLDA